MESSPAIVDGELDQYVREFRIRRVEGRTAIDWWLEGAQRIRFQMSSTTALDHFSTIPAMSVEPERGFFLGQAYNFSGGS